MAFNSTEYEYALKLGEQAFSKLKNDQVPAWPRSYEVWFTYASGHNSDLVKAINQITANKGALQIDDIDDLHETYLSSSKTTAKADAVSEKLAEEIREILVALKNGAATSESAGAAFDEIEKQIGRISSHEQLAQLIPHMAGLAKSMATTSRSLNQKLKQSEQQINTLKSDIEEIRADSYRDALTGLANRRRFDKMLRQEIDAARIENRPLTLLMTDIDRFKKFNDTFGHQSGDQVLRLVGATLAASVKGQDTAARYGGEEFGVILPNTSLQNGMAVADHIRLAVRGKKLVKRSTGEDLGAITLSLGVAQYLPNEGPEEFVERADKALYAAKNAGRDCVMPSDAHAAAELSA